MPPILPQMRRDAVGPGEHRQMGGPDRVRIGTAAGIPDGGDVVDVDAEAKRRCCHRTFLAHQTVFAKAETLPIAEQQNTTYDYISIFMHVEARYASSWESTPRSRFSSRDRLPRQLQAPADLAQPFENVAMRAFLAAKECPASLQACRRHAAVAAVGRLSPCQCSRSGRGRRSGPIRPCLSRRHRSIGPASRSLRPGAERTVWLASRDLRTRRPVSPPSTTARALQARRAWRRSDAEPACDTSKAVPRLELKPEKGPLCLSTSMSSWLARTSRPQQVEAMVEHLQGRHRAERRQGRQDRDVGRQVPRLPHQEEPQGAFHPASTSTLPLRRWPRWSARCASTKTSSAS